MLHIASGKFVAVLPQDAAASCGGADQIASRIHDNIGRAKAASAIIRDATINNCSAHFDSVAEIYAVRMGRLIDQQWSRRSSAVQRTIAALSDASSSDWPTCRVRNDQSGFRMDCTGQPVRVLTDPQAVYSSKRDQLGNLKLQHQIRSS